MNYQPNPVHLLQYIGSDSLPEPDLEKLYDKHIFVFFDGHAIGKEVLQR